MKTSGTQTYELNGVRYKFDFDSFIDSFRRAARTKSVRLGALEDEVGSKAGVTGSAVHQWRCRYSAPSDLATLSAAAIFLDIEPISLLRKESEVLWILDERQKNAVSRIYREVADFLYLFDHTDGGAWKNYKVLSGSRFSQFVVPKPCYPGDELGSYADGADLMDAAWEWVLHALEREWTALGNHPLYGELAEFIDEDLLDVWNGKTNTEYRFEPDEDDEHSAHQQPNNESYLALKKCRDIIAPYL